MTLIIDSLQIKAINEEHDAVTAKLLSYEELLSAKNEELMRLKKECGQAKAKVAESENEGETLAVLRAQVSMHFFYWSAVKCISVCTLRSHSYNGTFKQISYGFFFTSLTIMHPCPPGRHIGIDD